MTLKLLHNYGKKIRRKGEKKSKVKRYSFYNKKRIK